MADVKDDFPKFCLNMIVKNEGTIIAKTLQNLTEHLPIDYWVISDTGSSDNTIEEIKSFFQTKNIPGEIYEDTWKDFGYNRSKALEHAFNKSEYLFIIDADDWINGKFILPNKLDKDAYHMGFGSAHGISYTRLLLVNNRKRWCFKGVLHEYIECLDGPSTTGHIHGDYYLTHNAVLGDRSKQTLQEKYLKDALILEKAYEESLKNNDKIYERYSFYCANSFRDCKKIEDAIKWYKIVLTHNNWDQEKYVSCIHLYECYKKLNQLETGIYYLVESIKYDTTRAECLYELILHYSNKSQKNVAYMYYSIFKNYYENNYKTNTIDNKLFVDNSKFNFYLPYHMIIICYYEKQFETGINMYKIIFTKKYREFNPFYVKHIFFNLQFYIDKVDPLDKDFFKLYQEYLIFLEENNYPLQNHCEFTSKYEKYLETNTAESVPTQILPVECSDKDIVVAILAKDKGF